MICLIPMAGRGDRFCRQLYRVPKPFIPVLGYPMFISALKSFPPADKYIFVCRREFCRKYRLREVLDGLLERAEIVLLDELTQGQACTCLAARHKFTPGEGLFIASCDYQTVYDKEKYRRLLANEEIDVIIWTFRIGTIKKADPNAFAYCRTEGNHVLEVVEKRTISDTPQLDPAVVGSFTYRDAALFVRGAEMMIEKNIRVNNEFYVATSINQLIEQGCNVVTFEVEKFISFGNSFELQMVQYWQEYFDRLEDHPYSIRPVQSIHRWHFHGS